MNDLLTFLLSSQRNTWLEYDDLSVYVRKSMRVDPRTKQTVKCFDIASVSAKTHGDGIFTKWLDDTCPILIENGFEALYIESILNQRFAEYFRGMGAIDTSTPDVNLLLYL